MTDVSGTEPTGERGAARRRWIKGALATGPAVMTLRGGTAWAMGSVLSCLGQDMGDPPVVTDDASAQAESPQPLRAAVETRLYSHVGEGNGQGEPVLVYLDPDNGGQWRYVNAGSSGSGSGAIQWLAGDLVGDGSAAALDERFPDSRWSFEPIDPSYRALVYIDPATGNPVAVGDGGSNGGVVASTSCWASIYAMKP